MDAPPQKPEHNNQWDADNPSAPKAPDRLSAYATSESEIVISWRDRSGNEDGFRIFESVEGEQGMHLVHSIGSDSTQVVSTDRRSNTDYSYYVEAFNVAGSSYRPVIKTSTKHAPPNAPLFKEISNIGAGSISIEWYDNSQVEINYILDEAIANPFNFHNIKTVLPDCTTVLVDSLTSDVLYWYRISAINEDGRSKYSEPMSIRID